MDFKKEKDWRKRLITADRIDVLFNANKKEYEHATIIEARIMPSKDNRDDEPIMEYRIGFRIYCDNGEEEDKDKKRYNGWAED